MRKIYETDILYSILRPYVDLMTRSSYRRCRVSGKGNIPSDGAVILAPNHCNALMDALVVLQSRRGATVFGARADAFTPLFSGILSFLKILPMVRKRDGLRNVLRNVETIDRIAEVLHNGVPFCIFSEGAHRTRHSLMPLTKGIFRVAMEAYGREGGLRPVYIVPAGLEYGDYSRFRSTVLLTFGKPLDVSKIIRSMEGQPEAHIYAALSERLSAEMKKLFTCLDDDGDYDARWVIVRAVSASVPVHRLEDRLSANRKVAEKLSSYCKDNPEQASELFAEALDFEAERLKSGVSYHSLGKRHSWLRIGMKSLAAIAGFPYFVAASIACFPVWALAEKIRSGVKDKAFWNTVRFGAMLGMLPFLSVIWAILAFFLLPWYYALPVFLLCLPSCSYVYDYAGFVRILASDIRLASNRAFRNRAADFQKKIKTQIQ